MTFLQTNNECLQILFVCFTESIHWCANNIGFNMSSYYFEEVSNGYMPSDWTTGPWSPDHQHGGAPTMLIGHLLQEQSQLALVRLTVEFLRPVPKKLMRAEFEKVRSGKKVESWSCSLFCDGEKVVSATGLFIQEEQQSFELPKHTTIKTPVLPDPNSQNSSKDIAFTFDTSEANMADSIEIILSRGEYGKGEVGAWLRMRGTVLKDKPATPLDRFLAVADCGNGIAGFLDIKKYSFINPDLTVYINRLPKNEWVHSDAKSFGCHNGIGLSDSAIFDEEGFIGRVNQSLLLREH